jgi:hypothetical protein
MPEEQPTFMLFRLVRRKRSYNGWGWVLVTGILLTVLALLDVPRAGSAAGVSTTADGSTGCQMQVTSAELRVRSGPSVNADPLETLTQGAVVDGTTQVTEGFRLLKGNRWAANEFLVPIAGTSC